MAAYFAVVAVTAGAVSLVLLSPLILRQLGNAKGVNWAELSYVGQTYGAASAVLSAVALLGVSISLLVQTRQARTERVRITRERHIELLQIILSDPDVYYPVTGGEKWSTINMKQITFSNMWIHYAQVGFVMGVLSEEDIRVDLLQPAFEGEPMRKWWASARKSLDGRAVQDRRERRFIQLVDDEYRKAISAGPSFSLETGGLSPVAASAKSANSKRRDILNGALLGIVVGIIIRWLRWPGRH